MTKKDSVESANTIFKIFLLVLTIFGRFFFKDPDRIRIRQEKFDPDLENKVRIRNTGKMIADRVI